MAQPSCPDSRAAAFSRCGRYRWWLSRRWRDNAPTLLFLGLNPSRADHQRDDPTLRRLIGFADGWGYGGVEVVNLFGWISADPAALRQVADPVGRNTDAWIRRCLRRLLQQNTNWLNATLLDATGLHTTAVHAQAVQRSALAATGLVSTTLTREGARPEGCSQPGDRGAVQPQVMLPLWLGWGNGGRWRNRDQQMLQLLSRLPVRLFSLGLTAGGQPRHPLYVRAGSPLLPFGASWEHTTDPTTAPCPAPRAATRST